MKEEDRAAYRGPGDIRGLIEFTSSPGRTTLRSCWLVFGPDSVSVYRH